MSSQEIIICGNCNKKLLNTVNSCLFCGSTKKVITLDFIEKIDLELKDTITGNVKNPSLRSKYKLREKFFLGASKSANGDWAEKTQIINRDKDYYFEKVEDSTGEIIHFCEEKLSEHKGHGSDKPNDSASH